MGLGVRSPLPRGPDMQILPGPCFVVTDRAARLKTCSQSEPQQQDEVISRTRLTQRIDSP